MLAILEQAIGEFQKYACLGGESNKTKFREAEEYILKQDDKWLFSFNNICEYLGKDSSYLRQGLMKWKEKKLSESPPSNRRRYIKPLIK